MHPAMTLRNHPALSLSRQCRLPLLGRSSLQKKLTGESAETLALLWRFVAVFRKYPFAASFRLRFARVGRV